MRILQTHVDFLEYEPVQKEISLAEEVPKEKVRIENVLVLFVSVEKGDTEELAHKATEDAHEFMQKLKAKKILIYPFAHLSQNLAPADNALKILRAMEAHAKNVGLETYRAPFGWNKALEMKVKGHPLAEQSRVYTAESVKTKKIEAQKINKEYFVLTPDGKLHKPESYKFKKSEENFKVLVEKEALGKEQAGGGEPEYIKHMKKFGIDWESLSDLGHMRYGPEGAFIFDMISDYSSQLVNEVGMPVFNVKGTNMFNLSNSAIREHADLFGSRMYTIDSDNKNFVLRYAACFQQFAMVKDWQISYKNLPFGAFEVADSYRHEQSGELLLSFRVRKMHMPDFHVFCADLKQAQEQFFSLHKKIYEEMQKLDRDYVSLYNLTSKEFFEENREWILKLVKHEKKPVLLAFYPKGINYYWVLNIEYHVVDALKRPREIGTVQIDVGNAKRFGIKFVDKDGSEKRPVILHSAIIGTIERYLYTLFDTALRKKNPQLPLWVSPTQVRIIPLNEKYSKHSVRISNEFAKENIRADVDDRNDTVGKKIRDAEVSWVPYTIIFGPKEVKSKKIAVRARATGKVSIMTVENFVKQVRKQTEGKPFRKLTLPKLLSQRPNIS